MYKIAILGCENSHANGFLNFFKDKDDVECIGVYSDDLEAAKKLNEQFNVPVMENYDEAVGKVDGIIITARHGDNHYKYAKPYIKSGIPMFIDKPITVSEQDAKNFMAELKENNVPISGGSCVPLEGHVQAMKQAVLNETYGKTIGGFVRAPLNPNNPYGGFFFYSQHAVQIMTEIFGNYPNCVHAFKTNDHVTCTVHYDAYDINCQLTTDSWIYYAAVGGMFNHVGNHFALDTCFTKEYQEYYDLLKNKQSRQSYEDFFAPVFILNAIARSLESGKTETVNRIGDL
ncbi:MAG: Gfo/Idh/MocA family oxidoreductase [Clostridia bacterium]|nr:Gfo/Idh/MocA family oxidoreductase [Clostridia bacterium]